MHNVLRYIFTNNCRFHLGQAWWRKIQVMGLSPQYQENNNEVGKWLIITAWTFRNTSVKNKIVGWALELLIKMSMEGFSPVVCLLVS
jgi:hypothetical protein